MILAAVTGSSFLWLGAGGTASAQANEPLFNGAKSQACQGANLSNTDADCRSGAARSQVEGIVTFIVNLLTFVVGIAAVIMIIINGLKFITSSGDSNAISAAKNGIIYAIVGLIVVALAQIIVRYVVSKV